MGLFFELLNSINDPKQSGNIDQLARLVHATKSISQQHNLDAGTMQSVLSALSGPMRETLQNSGSRLGNQAIDSLSGNTNHHASTVGNIFTPQLQQTIVQAVSQKTGLNSHVLQAAIPVIIPVVLNLFKMGGSSLPNQQTGMNSLLEAFLKGDRSDLGQVMQYADRFLNPA